MISSGGIVSGGRMSVRFEAMYLDLGASSLLAQPATQDEGEADHSVIAMDSRASQQLPLGEKAAMVAGAFEEQDVVVFHVLHPELI